MDALLLGFFDYGPDAIGVYHVATRLVTIAVFVLAPVNASFGPHLAHLYHQGRLDEVRRIYRVATGWVLRLSLPAFVALLVFPEQLLRLVGGPGLAGGAAVTVVLALGQLVNAATGPCGTLLNMSGRVSVNMADNLAALLLNVLLNLWLIPAYGILGAAVAWAVSLAAVNIARVWQVRAQVHTVPVTAGMVKGLVAGAGRDGRRVRCALAGRGLDRAARRRSGRDRGGVPRRGARPRAQPGGRHGAALGDPPRWSTRPGRPRRRRRCGHRPHRRCRS